MNKKLLSILFLLPLMISACGRQPDNPGDGDDPQIDDNVKEKYMNNLKSTSQANHFYYHYLRNEQKASDFNKWDVWVWPYRPEEGQGVRFDWVGRTSAADKMSATGDATIDSLGYATIDVDLTQTYKGGWDAATKRMTGEYDVVYLPNGEVTNDVQIGTQIVYSESRSSASGFWKNDGGNVYLTLSKFKLQNTNGTYSYHAFVYEDHAAKPTAEPVVSADSVDNPFDGDNGGNVTYGKDAYKTADWSDKAIQATSDKFLKTAGVGYQIMVSSFADSDRDGFGDIYGIQQKLDYLENLGVKVLWLTPIQKSDSYHGYDIADYLTVDAKFGSKVSPAGVQAGEVTEDTAKADYKALINAAHEKGMLVVMDLVLNHTSTTNNWFIKSAQLDKAMRGYYQWGNNKTDATNINENKYWYPYGDHVYSYYAKFGSSMPELNYAYADTRTAVETMAKNWCEFGVDGFRMDAVKHIFLQDEIDQDNNDTYISDTGSGINYSSDLTKNLNFWKELNYEVKKAYPNAFFVGENFDGHAYHVAPFYEGFDSLFDFYSYFNLTSHASYFYHDGNLVKDPDDPNAGSAYQGAYAASFAGAWNSSGTPYSANADADLFGNKSKSIKYGDGWNLVGTFNTYNKYRTGGTAPSASAGYQMINGAFTSNHDIARTINRIAGTKSNRDGLTQQGDVTTSNYNELLKYTTLVQITELMLPGLTWIYYGDELGMTGNFPAGKNSKSGYADLAYRQPMKWKQGGQIGDGSMTTGYSISGADVGVEWDGVNSTSTVPDAETQVASASSHYSILSSFAKAKNANQALINGLYEPYYADIIADAQQKTVFSFKRTLGSKSYRVVVNMGKNAVNLSTGGGVVAYYGSASPSSVGGLSAALIDLGGSGGGGGDQQTGYSLSFEGKDAVTLTYIGVSDYGKDEYKAERVSFKTGDKFSILNNSTSIKFAPAVNTYSFGGTSGTDTKWQQYLSLNGTTYTVLKDFTADVYCQFKMNDDTIYFELK